MNTPTPVSPDELSKYRNDYVELYDAQVRQFVSSGLHPDLLKVRSISALVKVSDDKWLAILRYDLRKDMEGRS